MSINFISGDLRGLASSAALLARLFAAGDDDLLRLRIAVNGASNSVPGLAAWLDHIVGWEQDRRAGYIYPLRSPTESIHSEEVAGCLAVVQLLTIMFRDAAQIASLLDLVAMILAQGPLNLPQRHQNDHQAAA